MFAVEVQETAHLCRDRRRRCFAVVRAESRLRSSLLPLGSPIMPVAPPTNAIGRWPACLETPQQHQLHHAADVQTGCGRVKTDVDGLRPGAEQFAQALFVGHLMDQSSPLQFGQEIVFRHGRLVVQEWLRPKVDLRDA